MDIIIAKHRPGAISAFFIYKAGLFALGFWTWLAILAVTGGPVSGWHFVAGTGAATTTLVGVVLGVRYATQRNAATRHEEIMRALVDISWSTFASSAGTASPGPLSPGPLSPGPLSPDAAPSEAPPVGATPPPGAGPLTAGQASGEGADVIQLAQDLRQRPRR